MLGWSGGIFLCRQQCCVYSIINKRTWSLYIHSFSVTESNAGRIFHVTQLICKQCWAKELESAVSY